MRRAAIKRNVDRGLELGMTKAVCAVPRELQILHNYTLWSTAPVKVSHSLTYAY